MVVTTKNIKKKAQKELAAVATIWSFDAFNEGSDFGVFVNLNFIVEVYQAKVFFEA